MKNLVFIHILLFIILMIAYNCASAQDYLVTTRGDTLFGEVKPLTYGIDQKVQLTAANKKKTIYPLFQVREYRLKDETFHPVKGPNGYAFMKLVKAGYLSLYAFQMERQVTYDGLYLLKRDGSGTEVPNLSFKKVLKNFLADCPDVVEKVDDGVYSKRQVDQVVDDYNECISGRTVDHAEVIAQRAQQNKKISAWDTLKEKINAEPDFSEKKDALEMVSEIKNKISRGEKVPNFMVEGLKNSLQNTGLKAELENALKEIQ